MEFSEVNQGMYIVWLHFAIPGNRTREPNRIPQISLRHEETL